MPTAHTEPAWLLLMRERLGTQEVPGAADNPVILDWFAKIGHPEIEADEVSWCAVTVGATLKDCNLPIPPRDVNMMARSYLSYGVKCAPQPGAIAIWPRGKAWQGHVNVVESVTDDGKVICIGGNQSRKGGDAVTRTKGCGIYFAPHRGSHIYRATCEITDGYGFVFEPTGACNTMQGLYTELNGDSLVATGGAGAGQTAYDGGRATRTDNGLCWLGDSGAGSMHCRVVDSWFAAGAIYVGGTAITSSRKEGAVEFDNVAGGSVFETTHSMWRMVNCGEEYMAGITGTASTGAMVLPAGIQFDKDGDTLSYFDEGTWTPTIGGSSTPGTPTYSVQVGKYQRVGKRVTFEGYVVITAISGSPAGTVRIGGLPFATVNTGNYRCAVHIPYWIGFTSGVAGGVIEPNTDYIDIYRYIAGSVAVLNATEISATSRLMFSGSYEVA